MESNNNNNISDKVFQKLLEFEQLEMQKCSPNWDTNLEQKLKMTEPTTTNNTDGYSIFILALFLVNVGLFALSVDTNKTPTTSRTVDLQIISNELLISSNE
jgi:hypothetical protein